MAKGKTNCTKPVKAALEVMGYHVAVVEKWNAFARKKLDMFNWVDIVAVSEDTLQPLFIQCTSRGNMSSRIKKAQSQPSFKACRDSAQCYVTGVDKADGKTRIKWVNINGTPVEDKPK